jgi:hypothetical protein
VLPDIVKFVLTVPLGGQFVLVAQVSAARSTSAIGSLMTPLAMSISQKSNQRCNVSTHADRRKSNGSTWPSCDSQILRGTLFAASASHHWP